MLQFTRKPLERLKFVFQTGGRNPKVTQVYTGLESFVYGAILYGNIKLTPKGRCLVFGFEDNKYLGYIAYPDADSLPKRYKPDPEDEGTYFEDWYTSVE